MEHHGGNVCKAAVMEKAYGRWTGLLFGLLLCDTDLAGRLHHYFGQNQTLTNAHNEFLNQLFCTGGIGFAAFVGFLAAAVCRFWKNREKEPMALMGLLAVLVYGAHNFFCYQQVCCIPFLFLLIAMSENLVRKAAEK